jgi:RNA polymerase sigma-70 factor (ECF subfamily)
VALADIDVRALVEQHKQGDTSAFDEIVRRHAPRLLAHARMRLSDRQAAEDAVQETFLRAYRAMPRFNGEFHLQAWLHRICTNVCYDELDRRRRNGIVETRLGSEPIAEEIDSDPADEQRAEAMRVRLGAALDQIPGQYREALVLHYGEHLPFREIAKRTGVSEENARARASRGRRALRKIMAAPMGALMFLIPAVRRSRAAVALDASGGSVDHAASVGQTSTFVNQVVPTVARVINEAGPAMTGKAQLITGAVAAASAVAVPVAANQVIQNHYEKPAAAVAEAPVTTRVSALKAPTATTISVPSGSGAAGAAAAGATKPAGVLAGDSSGATATTLDDGTAGQVVTPTSVLPVVAPTIVPTTAPSGASTTSPSVAPPVAGVATAAAITVTSASATGDHWSLSGKLTLTPKGGTANVLSYTAYATVTEGATDKDPDRIDVTFKAGNVSVRVLGRGTLAADRAGFALSSGAQFSVTAPADDGYISRGTTSGVIALAAGEPFSLQLG